MFTDVDQSHADPGSNHTLGDNILAYANLAYASENLSARNFLTATVRRDETGTLFGGSNIGGQHESFQNREFLSGNLLRAGKAAM
jgi:hypothetical protein